MRGKYEGYCQTLGVLRVGLTERQMKEQLAEKMISRCTKDSAIAKLMIAGLASTTDENLETLIETFAYNNNLDAPSKKRGGIVRKLARVSQVRQVRYANQEYKWSDEKAAKQVYGDWKGIHKNSNSFLTAFFKDLKVVNTLQAKRNATWCTRLLLCCAPYANDPIAKRLLIEALYWCREHSRARERNDILGSLFAEQQIDKVFAHRHPFATRLAAYFASVENVWLAYGAQVDKDADDSDHKGLTEFLSRLGFLDT